MYKRVILFSVILILTLVGMSGCGDSDDKSNPEDVAKGYMDAAQDENLKKMASYCTEDFFETIDTEKVFELRLHNNLLSIQKGWDFIS